MRCLVHWRRIERQSLNGPGKPTWSNPLTLQIENLRLRERNGIYQLVHSLSVAETGMRIVLNSSVHFGTLRTSVSCKPYLNEFHLIMNLSGALLSQGHRGGVSLVEAPKWRQSLGLGSSQQPLVLPGERAGVKANESNGSSYSCCDSAAQTVSEYTHNGRTEEDHAHGKSSYPCCRE